MMNLP